MSKMAAYLTCVGEEITCCPFHRLSQDPGEQADPATLHQPPLGRTQQARLI